MRKFILSTIIFLSIIVFCSELNNTSSAVPPYLKDEINTSGLTQVEMDSLQMEKVWQDISLGVYPNIHSLLIYKNNHLVYEKYLEGKDEKMGIPLDIVQHSTDVLHDVRSITKSVVSTCVGIAIAQGKIKSENELVFGFFPEYAQFNVGEKRAITLHHLLRMTSGLLWNEELPYTNPLNTERMMDTASNPVAFVLSRPLDTLPGTKWQYNGGNTEVLAAIIEKSTGKTIEEFANEYLFKPLGIEEYEWDKFSQIDKPSAARGLRLRSRDLLKFGILYLQNGEWKKNKIISENWIQSTFKNAVSTTRKMGEYGNHFWIYNDSIQGKPVTCWGAVGNGGQRIFIDQKNKLVVVITAGNYNQWKIKNDSYALLRRIYETFSVR